MSFNKKELIENFKNKNYSFCIEMLSDKIIDNLVSEIKKQNPNFEYVNITNLKNNCLKYLYDSKKIIAIQLYDYMYNDDYSEAFVLDNLLSMYETLYSENIYA